jgi:hypothetical protein
MRSFRIDWIVGENYLHLSELIHGGFAVINRSTQENIAAKLILESSGSDELSIRLMQDFAKMELHGKNTYPQFWSSEQVKDWILKILGAKI